MKNGKPQYSRSAAGLANGAPECLPRSIAGLTPARDSRRRLIDISMRLTPLEANLPGSGVRATDISSKHRPGQGSRRRSLDISRLKLGGVPVPVVQQRRQPCQARVDLLGRVGMGSPIEPLAALGAEAGTIGATQRKHRLG